MLREDKPNVFLNVLCFLLPFPIAFFLPPFACIPVSVVISKFINPPAHLSHHVFLKTLPAVYIIVAVIQVAIASKFVNRTSSPRSKSAAQILLRSASFVAVIVVLPMGYVLLSIVFD